MRRPPLLASSPLMASAQTATEQANPSDSKATKKALWIIWLTLFMDLVGFSIIFPLGPAMLSWYLPRESDGGLLSTLVQFTEQLTSGSTAGISFGTTVLFGGVLGGLYSLLQFFFAPVWGRLSDKIGRRKVLLFSVAGVALSYLIWFFSGSFLLLILSRCLGGIMSGNLSVATAAVADVTTRENRSKGMALIGIAFGLGFLIGPALGGTAALVDLSQVYPKLTQFGVNPFSLPALIAFVFCSLNWWLVWRYFKETLPEEKRAPQQKKSESLLQSLGNASAGVRQVSVINLFFLIAFSGMEFSLTFLAAERLGYGPAENTWMFLYIGGTLLVVQGYFVRKFVSRIGERPMTCAGLTVGVCGLALLGQAHSTAVLYAGITLMSAGIGMTSPMLAALASLYSTEQTQGRDLGLLRSLGALARAIGPLLAAFLYWKLGATLNYTLGALLLLVPLALTVRLPRDRQG